MAFVAQHPANLSLFYADDYYDSADDGGVGYTQYDDVASTTIPWAVELVRQLLPSGRVLDVGAADGRLLDALGSNYGCSAIEVNTAFAQQMSARGIDVVSQDIADECLRGLAGQFDVITALAVLEHVADIGAAVTTIGSLLAPTGVIVIQVPLVFDDGPEGPWFTSSFEHIAYPTEQGLRCLFTEVAGLHLIGEAVEVEGFGSEFIGLATRDSKRAQQVAKLWEHLRRAPSIALNDREKAFRFMLECVYLAHRNPEILSLLPSAIAFHHESGVLARLGHLWSIDNERARHVGAVIEARDWHADQVKRWQAEWSYLDEQVRSLNLHVASIEAARDGHADDARQWREKFEATLEPHSPDRNQRWRRAFRQS